MQKIPKRVPDKKVLGTCLTKCLVDIGEFSLCANWALINPRAAKLYSGVMKKATIRNINSNGTMLSPCLKSTFLPMTTLNKSLLYMRLIANHSHGGATYFPSMTMSNVWLEASKALTRSDNATHVGGLWLCLRCRSVLICECTIWTSNSISGSKLSFNAVFDDYLEYSSTHDTYIHLVADVH